MTEDERKTGEDLLAYLVKWERFFDTGGAEGEGLFGCTVPGLKIGLSGAGFLSTRFTCRFVFGRVSADCECIATVDVVGETDEPRWLNALATVRLAMLLVRKELDGIEWLQNDPEATVRVYADPLGVAFEVSDGRGEVCMGERNWDGLVRLLEQLTGGAEALMIKV